MSFVSITPAAGSIIGRKTKITVRWNSSKLPDISLRRGDGNVDEVIGEPTQPSYTFGGAYSGEITVPSPGVFDIAFVRDLGWNDGNFHIIIYNNVTGAETQANFTILAPGQYPPHMAPYRDDSEVAKPGVASYMNDLLDVSVGRPPPATDDNKLVYWNNAAGQFMLRDEEGVGGGGDVTAAANIGANALVAGDDGAKGVKGTGLITSANGDLFVPGSIVVNGTVDTVDIQQLEQQLIDHAAEAPGHPTSFPSLIDTPSSYIGQAGRVVRVRADEQELEFANPVVAGEIAEVPAYIGRYSFSNNVGQDPPTAGVLYGDSTTTASITSFKINRFSQDEVWVRDFLDGVSAGDQVAVSSATDNSAAIYTIDSIALANETQTTEHFVLGVTHISDRRGTTFTTSNEVFVYIIRRPTVGGSAGGTSYRPGYGVWTYDNTATVATGTASGTFRLNGANPATATEIYIHGVSKDSVDFGTANGFDFAVGDKLIVCNADGTEAFYATAADGGSIASNILTLTLSASERDANGTTLTNATDFSFVKHTQPGGAGTIDGSGSAGQYARWVDSNTLEAADATDLRDYIGQVVFAASEPTVADGVFWVETT